jgi:hypothetical protein
MGAGTVRLSSASSDDFEIAMSGIAKPQERASLLRRLQERLHMPEQPLVRPHNPAPEDNEALAGELAEEEPRSLRGLSTAWGAIRNAMISAGTRVGPPATSAGKWAWTTISALPGRIDRVLKSVAGEGNQLVYHFLQVLAVAAAAAVAGGCALIVFLSVSSFYSWSGFFALLAAATLIIVGGKTTERSRALGGGIAALGLVTLLLSLLFIGVRLLTFRR